MNKDDDVAFYCRLDDLKTLIDLISCLYMDISKDTECDIEVTPESFFIRVTSKSRNSQVVSIADYGHNHSDTIDLFIYRVVQVSDLVYLKNFIAKHQE